MDTTEQRELVAIEGQRIISYSDRATGEGVELLDDENPTIETMVNLVFADGHYRQYMVGEDAWNSLWHVCAQFLDSRKQAVEDGTEAWRDNAKRLVDEIVQGHLLTPDTPGHTPMPLEFAEQSLPLHKRTRGHLTCALRADGSWRCERYVLEVEIINAGREASAKAKAAGRNFTIRGVEE